MTLKAYHTAPMNVKSIVIVGGGSAGWMSAALLAKIYPNIKITVIEDPNTPPIGVGESTYEGIRYYCRILEIDEKSFFKHTNASIKIGLQFSDLYDVDKSYEDFTYPFGHAQVSGTKWGIEDWLSKKDLYPETPWSEFFESYFPQVLLAKHNTFSKNEHGKFGHFNPATHTALHFDAVKFGGWLRDQYCLPKGVTLLRNTVVNIPVNEQGIEKLIFNDGSSITADLFIDCTGFKSLLLDKTLKEKFISFNDVLPNNRAWATQLEYQDKETELDALTKCTFIENGWCWNIPLWSRLGAGYVYSDNFVEPEIALEEFKTYLKSSKMKVPRTDEVLNNAKFVDIKMRVGIHERVWVKNVVAIGLAAGFIEPLESNGLFTVHNFLYHLVRALERGKVSQWTIDVFNRSTYLEYFRFVEFIRMHYALSLRTDTPYWKANFSRSYDFSDYTTAEQENSNLHILFTAKVLKSVAYPNGGLTPISIGLQYPTIDKIPMKIGEIESGLNYIEDLQPHFNFLENRRIAWESEAKNSPSFYDYLRTEYYEE